MLSSRNREIPLYKCLEASYVFYPYKNEDNSTLGEAGKRQILEGISLL